MTTHETGRTGGTAAEREGECPARRRLRRTTAAALLGVAYWTLVRPRMLNWGATAVEARTEFPGDELLPDPDAESTMAITVHAPPGDIWPWLLQLGQERGGFYSYEWAENLVGLDVHNADHVFTEWQDLSVGDTIRLGSADRYPDAELDVAAMEPRRSLVLQTPTDPRWWVWSFVLDPVDETATRLLVRSRIRLPQNPALRVASQSVLDPVTFVMTRGMLLGIRNRAEQLAATPREAVPDEDAPE